MRKLISLAKTNTDVIQVLAMGKSIDDLLPATWLDDRGLFIEDINSINLFDLWITLALIFIQVREIV